MEQLNIVCFSHGFQSWVSNDNQFIARCLELGQAVIHFLWWLRFRSTRDGRPSARNRWGQTGNDADTNIELLFVVCVDRRFVVQRRTGLGRSDSSQWRRTFYLFFRSFTFVLRFRTCSASRFHLHLTTFQQFKGICN